MRRMFVVMLVLSLLLSIGTGIGLCTPNYNNWGATDTNMLLKREIPFDMIHTGHARDGTSIGVSEMVSGSTAVPLNYGLVYKYIGTTVGQAGTLANGRQGQMVTIVIKTRDASGTFVLTPTTKTGFASLTFDAVGEAATLLYTGENYGWIIIGVNGTTVNQ